MKKLIAILLCAVMLCTCLPAVSFAEDGTVEQEAVNVEEHQNEQAKTTTEATTDAEVADEPETAEVPAEPAMRAATRTAHPVLTEVEAAAAAVQTYDVSAAQDGTVTAYLVPNGDETYSLYMFGAGATVNYDTATASTSTIGPWYEDYAEKIVYAYIGDGITTLGDLLFYSHQALTEISLPETLTSVGYGTFAKCAALQSVTLPDAVTTIGTAAFQTCDSLTEIVLGNGLTTIEGAAFANCLALTSIDIPASVTSIANSAFQTGVKLLGDAQLRSINVATENQFYSSVDGVLYNKEKTQLLLCPVANAGTITIPEGVTSIPEEAFKARRNLETVVFPNTLTTIGKKAFYYAGITHIEIPASVTTIDRQVFAKCFSLTGITVDPNNTAYCSDEYGVLYNKSKSDLYCFPAGLPLTTYTIPSTVRHIRERAFGGNPYLSGTITIPSTCTDVGSGAFSDLKNVDKIVWKTAAANTTPYVHEDIRPVWQGYDSVCTSSAIGSATNTLLHMENDCSFYIAEARLSNNGKYGGVNTYVNFYNKFGVNYEKYTYNTANIKNIVKAGLSEGKIAIIACVMDTGANYQHVYCVYGISEEGYLYIYDPSYPDATMTQYDPELLFHHKDNSNIYLLSVPADVSMKDEELTMPAASTTHSLHAASPKRGTNIGTNGNGTYLTKQSEWTDYNAGKAHTELTFSYETEATDYIYVLDYSDSMTKLMLDPNYTNMSIEKTMAYHSIENVLTNDPTARVSVIDFRGQDEATYTEFTNDPADLYDVLAGATTQGFTCYADGFEAALAAMNSRTGDDANRKTVVVFMTDGDQNMWCNENDLTYLTYQTETSASASGNSNYGATEAAALRAAGAKIYAVVLNPDATDATEAKMAEITGDTDKVHIATTIAEVGEALNDVVEAAALRSFVLTDTIGDDFLYDGNLTASEGTTAVIDATNRTITWTLENILPNTEYTLTFGIQCKRNSTGQFVTGDLPTNEGDAEVTEDGETVNTVESPVLHRDPVISTDGAQAHMIHQYADLTRPDNPALYTDGIRFCVTLDMEELQAELDPGDKVALGIVMLPLNKLHSGGTTNYLTVNVAANGKLTSNGSYTFVNNSSAISRTKQLNGSTMVTWTQAMEDCTSAAAFANLLKTAGVTIFDVTDEGVRISVYMMFSNAATRQAQADREIAYRGVIVTYNAEDGYVTRYSLQRNNSATRVFNHYNCLNYGVINVDGASEEEMLHGESEYNPAYELQVAAVIE